MLQNRVTCKHLASMSLTGLVLTHPNPKAGMVFPLLRIFVHFCIDHIRLSNKDMLTINSVDLHLLPTVHL